MSRPFLLGVALAALVVSPVLAQERDAGERQRLLDLAYALGESHALRQVCEGEGDQYWRARMVRLTEVEQADQAFDVQMRERFNTGFASRRSEYPTCDAASRKAEQQAARRGQALAQKLSRSVRKASPPVHDPDSMAEGEGAR
ncbi:TIGR02301 family protein [Caulobacter sp. 1776]|uniref:TIGR02301 family protein n=1 Tax=Caulobacter sp. 1776 TaxID=3156420 RepID=UPI003397390F